MYYLEDFITELTIEGKREYEYQILNNRNTLQKIRSDNRWFSDDKFLENVY